MDHDRLLASRCWFAGGTEIVLDLDEYRLSRDIDFLCADPAGYRALRSDAVLRGAAAFFRAPVRPERDVRTDQYGLRGIVSVLGVAIRFEIVRESRIELNGVPDLALGVPRLSPEDRVTEKLLANADRCQDSATHYRDAIDLGMLALRRGPLPAAAFEKAHSAYGDDIMRKLAWALDRLADPATADAAATALGMDPVLVRQAAGSLAGQVPGAGPRPPC